MAIKVPDIAGLSKLEGPSIDLRNTGSKFVLPPSFDPKKWSAKWVPDGPEVIEAQQEQILEFAGVKAQGWSVFKVMKPGQKLASAKKGEGDAEAKDDEKSKPEMIPYTRAVGKTIYVLMYRPKSLQTAINAMYANQSTDLVNGELQGVTSQVNEGEDPGILTNADLRRAQRMEEDPEVQAYFSRQRAEHPDRAVELNLAT